MSVSDTPMLRYSLRRRCLTVASQVRYTERTRMGVKCLVIVVIWRTLATRVIGVQSNVPSALRNRRDCDVRLVHF